MKNRTFSIALSLFLMGCVTRGEAPGEFIPLPQRSDTLENIEVTRKSIFFASGLSLWLTVDGQDVAKIRGNKIVRFGLEAKVYNVGVRCGHAPLDVVRDWYHTDTEIDVTDDLPLYQIEVGMTGWDRLTKAYEETTPLGPCYIKQVSP